MVVWYAHTMTDPKRALELVDDWLEYVQWRIGREGRSARDVELAIGYNSGDISRMRIGRNRPRVEMIFLLEQELGLSPIQMFVEYAVWKAARDVGREELEELAVNAVEQMISEGPQKVLSLAVERREETKDLLADSVVRRLLHKETA